MRVLLAGRHVPGGRLKIGGVQTWTQTVASELQRQGHRVKLWCPEFRPPAERFDVGILANVCDTRRVAALCDKVLAVSHGIIEPERPPSDMPVAFTSEGVRDHWNGTGAIIRQPIDLEYWCPDGRKRSGIISYSYRDPLDFMPEVAMGLGMSYAHLRSVTQDVARDAMRTAEVVLASGRAAVEAAACGAAVVICDNRPYQGPLIAPFGEWQMRNNYAGRGGKIPTPELARSYILSAMDYVDDLPALVRRHHDARKVVSWILALA